MQCIRPIYLVKRDLVVPCGKCGFCLATRRSDWATRIEYESRRWYNAKFITLTYEDKYLVYRNGISQLDKRDLQNYFKRLRKGGVRLRYFAVGEYGSHTGRPHYHVLLFTDHPEKDIRAGWDKGIVHVGSVTQASISYCLKYIINSKAKGMIHGRVAAFAVMSRKPGLGHNYLSPAMIEWHKDGRKNHVLVGGEKRHLPRYYKTKIFSKIDCVRIAVRDQRQAFDNLRKRLRDLSRIPVNKYYPLGALSYIDEQNLIAEKRIKDKTRKYLTI